MIWNWKNKRTALKRKGRTCQKFNGHKNTGKTGQLGDNNNSTPNRNLNKDRRTKRCQ